MVAEESSNQSTPVASGSFAEGVRLSPGYTSSRSAELDRNRAASRLPGDGRGTTGCRVPVVVADRRGPTVLIDPPPWLRMRKIW
jgi:hypothetical protein